MDKERQAYYLTKHDSGAIKTAITWVLSRCRAGNVIIAVPVKDNLRGNISDTIGDDFVKPLEKNGEVGVQGLPYRIHLMTERKEIWRVDAKAVCAFYPTQTLLDKIDEMYGIEAVLVVPWIFEEIEPWIKTWGAREYGTDSVSQKLSVSDRHVLGAMKMLTRAINKSTGLSHPLDKKKAVDVFKSLQKFGIEYDVAEIRAWLLSEAHMSPDNADDIIKVASAIQQGRRVQGGSGKLYSKEILKRWEELADEE